MATERGPQIPRHRQPLPPSATPRPITPQHTTAEHQQRRVALPAHPSAPRPVTAPYRPNPPARPRAPSQTRRRDRPPTGLQLIPALVPPRFSAAAPPRARNRSCLGWPDRFTWRVEEGGPVREHGTPFLESPGAERKTARRRGSGLLSSGRTTPTKQQGRTTRRGRDAPRAYGEEQRSEHRVLLLVRERLRWLGQAAPLPPPQGRSAPSGGGRDGALLRVVQEQQDLGKG
jgi:hypothetical protein